MSNQNINKDSANPEDNNNNPETITVETLQKQIENLNKGIATYRDDSKKSSALVESLQAELKALKEKQEEKSDDDEDDELPPLTDADRKRLEKWAKDQGFATKEEIQQQKNQIQSENLKALEKQVVDEFLKDHPEYEKDEEWDKLKQEFGQYKQPTDIQSYRKILNKIHKDLHPSDDGEAKARASIENRKRLGLGGKPQFVKDDGEMTIDKMQEKYPHLSKDQIESRLRDIKSLYKDKDNK